VSKNAILGLNFLTVFWTLRYQPMAPIYIGFRTHKERPKIGQGELSVLDAIVEIDP
jgi:hypothetical protein